jgi:hypothetical protein
VDESPKHRILKGLSKQQIQDVVLLLTDALEIRVLTHGKQTGVVYIELYDKTTGEELSLYTVKNRTKFTMHVVVSDDIDLNEEISFCDVVMEFIEHTIHET